MASSENSPRLEMRGVHKRFGGAVALAGVDLAVASGEVHALIGENGAGKSTLMKVLSGAVRPDSGYMRLDGRMFAPADPLAARAAGVAMIYQELNLAPHLTVEQNIMLGAERTRWGVIRRDGRRRALRETLARLQHPALRPGALVRELPPAARQLVEIARALLSDARVLVMDEPTSSLGLADIERLFAIIDEVRRDGVAVIYISHFLEEVQRVAQRYTVLRDGEVVGRGALADVRVDGIVELMIGRRLSDMFPRVDHAPGAALLTLEGVAGRRLPHDASLTLHRGEILGLAGLVGAGRTELLRAVFGLDPVKRGHVRVAQISGGQRDPAGRLRQGVGLLSEDRQHEGLALGRSLADNITMGFLDPLVRRGVVWPWRVRQTGAAWMNRLGVRARDPGQAVRELSGGNQQKVALARLLHRDVDALLLDEPTRGVDVASKAQIYQLIGELAAAGKAVLLVSSYMPELLGVCDRIAVMHRGRLGPARAATEWNEHDLIAAAMSGKE